MKKILCVLLVLIMVCATMPVSFAKSESEAAEPVNSEAIRTTENDSSINTDEIVKVMVRLKDEPVASKVADVNSAEARKLADNLKSKQQTVLNKISRMMSTAKKLNARFSFTTLYNGFSIEVPMKLIEKINELPEVERAYIAPEYSAPDPIATEPDRLSTSVGYINADDAWDAGYTGKGTVIAIVDSGAVVAHNAFKTAPDSPKFTSDSISNILKNNNLQAEDLYSGTVSANNVYYSQKIPFKFDYAQKDFDVSHYDCGTDHGSHVAGIAAGNYSGSNYTGVAKDAQLVIMKVFESGGRCQWDTVLAALEDCVCLGVDAVNMSLGAACGFTSDDPYTSDVYSMLVDHGINIAVAAGNDGSSNGTQYYGSSYSSYTLAMNPDNGLAGTPSTYTESLGVACSQKSSSNMVYFSCHGPTPDLKLKPEIAAPGYNIVSARDTNLTGSTTTYGQMSGTSMSSPHIAGGMAILTNYVNEKWPTLAGRNKVDMVNRLLMCTANPIASTSPRAQGAGIVDLQKAITTKAYITVDGCARPKLELGDDPAKNGVYTLTFNVVNFSNTSLSYNVNPTILTENATAITMNGQNTYRFSNSYRNITSDCTITGQTSITVPANSTKKVTLTVRLSDSIKNTLNSQFKNGIYIDGYVVLDGTVDLTIPFLAFYGNWNQASVFDRYSYIDAIQGVNHFNIHNDNYQTQIGAKISSYSYSLFGVNPYISTNDWFADRCTLSPNGDKYYDQIDRVVYTLIRNAGEGGIEIYNENNPSNVYKSVNLNYMPKAWNYNNGDYTAPFYHTSDETAYYFSSWAPTGLAEGTHIVFKLYHYLDYPGFTPDQNECSEIVLPMTV
ncbi:MAG: S8 family serine peptidase, partial [Clostridia bacterium]|nr:S8 family serine peptidase [Clostridia bacterium]